MKKLPIFIFSFLFMIGFFLSPGWAVALDRASGAQPSIGEIIFDEGALKAGGDAKASLSVSGGTFTKPVSVSCELLLRPSEGPDQLWKRTIGNPFLLEAGAVENITVDCELPEVFSAQGKAIIRLAIINDRGYELDSKETEALLGVSGVPVILSDGLWQFESWNPPSDGTALIDATLNHYVGHKPHVLAKAQNKSADAREVFIKASVLKIGGNGEADIRNNEPLALEAGAVKDLDFFLPEIAEQGIYQAVIQLFDAKTQKPVSNIFDARYIAKKKIGESFMDIMDVNLDKMAYSADDSANVRIILEGSPTYTNGSKNVDVSVEIEKDGKTIAKTNGSRSLEESDFETGIKMPEDVTDPSIYVSVSKDGVLLSEYRAGSYGVKQAARDDEKKAIFDSEPAAGGTNNQNAVWLAAVLIAAGIIFFLIWKIRGKKTLSLLVAGASIVLPAIFCANPVAAASVYTSSFASGYYWNAPVAVQPWAAGDNVDFQGGFAAATYTTRSISKVRFYVSENVNVPTYNCGGGRQCLNTGAGVKIFLLGELPASGTAPTYTYDKTYTMPAGIDLNNGLRFWTEITGTYYRWHPDAMDDSYTETRAMWMIAYQSFGNGAQYISQNVPTTMISGQTYPATVTMKNIGITTWSPAGNYNLGSQNPADNGTWGLGRVSVGSPVLPAESKTFSFNVTAPAPGIYNFQWRMVQDGKEWFGDTTPNLSITVKQPVTIGGSVKDEKGAGIAGVVLDLCGAGTATTNAAGNWSKNIVQDDNYCVRISAGLPAGYNYIYGTSNTVCHTNASTYEWQVAGRNEYVNCTFADQRSWDLAADNNLNFLVNYCDCGAWSNSTCATGGCNPLQRQQTRICTPANCLPQSQCVDDSSCCACGAWSDDDCGKDGCPSNQMRQTRTCNVPGCQPESQCAASAVCPRTLTVSVTASPVSAPAPLATAITGTVGGTAIGTINYTTWFNCDDPCTTVADCVAACGAWDDKADGVAATVRTVNHTYAASGTFHPKMIVERHNLAAFGTIAVTAINAAPTASALIKQTDYCGSGLATMFSWNYSDPEGDAQTFRQIQVDDDADFSSPADDTGKVATASKSYVTLATKLDYDITYHWRVKVWDSWGNDSGWVNGPNFSTPLHSYPIVDFDFVPSPVKATEVITYSDRTQVFGGATVSSRSWEIEGANPDTSSAESPVVTYEVKGDYTTKLTVTDSNGYTCSLEEDINVKSSLPDWEEL